MHLNYLIKRLDIIQQSQHGFEYTLGKKLQLSDITSIENKLNVKIPEKIKLFYLELNELKTSNPSFEIINIHLWKTDNGTIHFATFDNTIKIFFDITKINAAEEWSIINKENNYEITLSISSFWSNKIWHWMEQKKKIWTDNWWELP